MYVVTLVDPSIRIIMNPKMPFVVVCCKCFVAFILKPYSILLSNAVLRSLKWKLSSNHWTVKWMYSKLILTLF